MEKRDHRSRKESGVSDSLGVGSDKIVLFVTEVDVVTFEIFENSLDQCQLFSCRPVLDQNLWKKKKRSVRTPAQTKKSRRMRTADLNAEGVDASPLVRCLQWERDSPRPTQWR